MKTYHQTTDHRTGAFATVKTLHAADATKSDNPMKPAITASEMGKIGGARKSAAKTKAARENAKKPRKKNAEVRHGAKDADLD
jgi:hypothetical protein